MDATAFTSMAILTTAQQEDLETRVSRLERILPKLWQFLTKFEHKLDFRLDQLRTEVLGKGASVFLHDDPSSAVLGESESHCLPLQPHATISLDYTKDVVVVVETACDLVDTPTKISLVTLKSQSIFGNAPGIKVRAASFSKIAVLVPSQLLEQDSSRNYALHLFDEMPTLGGLCTDSNVVDLALGYYHLGMRDKGGGSNPRPMEALFRDCSFGSGLCTDSNVVDLALGYYHLGVRDKGGGGSNPRPMVALFRDCSFGSLRGMAVEDPKAEHGLKLTIEAYPFANDGLALWDDCVNHYYPEELQDWWEEVRTKSHVDKNDEPWCPVFGTPYNLHNLTTIIWVTSGHNDPFEEFFRNFLKQPEVALHMCFPSQIQATKMMGILDVLSNHSLDEEYIDDNSCWGLSVGESLNSLNSSLNLKGAGFGNLCCGRGQWNIWGSKSLADDIVARSRIQFRLLLVLRPMQWMEFLFFLSLRTRIFFRGG